MNILCIYFDFLVEFGRNSQPTSHPCPTRQPGMVSRFLGGPAIPIWTPPAYGIIPIHPSSPRMTIAEVPESAQSEF